MTKAVNNCNDMANYYLSVDIKDLVFDRLKVASSSVEMYSLYATLKKQ